MVLIHDTAENGLAALKLCRRLIEQFNRDFLFHITICDLGSFESPMVQHPAMTGAPGVRLVFIAASEALPDSVWRWLDQWALNAGDRPAALALLRGDADRLKPLCERHAIDLICQSHTALSLFARAASRQGSL